MKLLLDRQITYSNTTYQNVFAWQASLQRKIQITINLIRLFHQKTLPGELQMNQRKYNKYTWLDNPRELVRWAYKSKVGDVSDVFEFGNKIVVASLTSIKKEGLKELEDIRNEVERLVLNQKKSEKLINELSSYNSLEEISSDFGSLITKVEGINFSSSQVPELGDQPEFVGASFALAEGQTSKVFAGKNAVFAIKVDKIITAPENYEISNTKNSIITNLKNRSSFQSYQSLVELFQIKEKRAKFY